LAGPDFKCVLDKLHAIRIKDMSSETDPLLPAMPAKEEKIAVPAVPAAPAEPAKPPILTDIAGAKAALAARGIGEFRFEFPKGPRNGKPVYFYRMDGKMVASARVYVVESLHIDANHAMALPVLFINMYFCKVPAQSVYVK
jgi:hypothetical protein